MKILTKEIFLKPICVEFCILWEIRKLAKIYDQQQEYLSSTSNPSSFYFFNLESILLPCPSSFIYRWCHLIVSIWGLSYTDACNSDKWRTSKKYYGLDLKFLLNAFMLKMQPSYRSYWGGWKLIGRKTWWEIIRVSCSRTGMKHWVVFSLHILLS